MKINAVWLCALILAGCDDRNPQCGAEDVTPIAETNTGIIVLEIERCKVCTANVDSCLTRLRARIFDPFEQ